MGIVDMPAYRPVGIRRGFLNLFAANDVTWSVAERL
jgi:hypothetical protein